MADDAKRCAQITPAHADHISGYDWTSKKGVNRVDEMLSSERVVVQTKHDGERMKMHFLPDGVVMDSRRISKKTGMFKQCQSNFPQFESIRLVDESGKPLGETVIDGELKAVRDGHDSWSDIVGVIHSLKERAIELQKSGEFEVKYMAFDCVMADGEDISDEPYEIRLSALSRVLSMVWATHPQCGIEIVECKPVTAKAEIYEARDAAISQGYEGVVIKSLERGYHDKGAYLKAKKFETKDVVVYGYDEGRGKYVGTVGALKLGYYDPETGSIVHVTDCNCGTDEDRAMWKKGLDDGTLLNAVIEVKCQEITDKSLRHPVYMRLRADKDYKMCTKDTIFDMKGEN